MAPNLTEAEYQLVVASGHVAETARALLVWLHDRANKNRCRCCEQNEFGWAGHDPSMPCGELRDAVKTLGKWVRAVALTPQKPPHPMCALCGAFLPLVTGDDVLQTTCTKCGTVWTA
jgi:hypothetical protein